MKKHKIVLIGFTLLMGLLSIFNSYSNVNASTTKYRSTTPVALRGTWYHLYDKKEGYDKPFVEKITINKHSMVDVFQKSRLHSRGKHFVISYEKMALKLHGYKTKHINFYSMWDQGDTPEYMSTYLRVNGKLSHVMLQTPQNGPFPIFTHFKPSKSYTISGEYKY
ncbi:hypothetical protein M2S00_03460 [Apilactobacillus sp. TMW 2.2459]|uniref:hypothetical protein n=1 Tax=Apilactobacillus xinyiensis TaxID=2841032 RepID=UPI00200D554C|nr:hypothetical protein [Apilactobacillus xinyiensis]MCL0312156.1 hypothetical protein [Apilactobacillus xinyiensis]